MTGVFWITILCGLAGFALATVEMLVSLRAGASRRWPRSAIRGSAGGFLFGLALGVLIWLDSSASVSMAAGLRTVIIFGGGGAITAFLTLWVNEWSRRRYGLQDRGNQEEEE